MSGHAFSTLNEYAHEACRMEIEYIGITDHGPSMENAAHQGYFDMVDRVPNSINNVRILFGCETNITNISGDLDLDINLLSRLKLVIAGLHEKTSYTNSSEINNTSAMVNALKKNRIHILAHPYRSMFPVNIEELVYAACENNTLLEINKSLILYAVKHINELGSRDVIEKTREMIDLLQNRSRGFVINSDAHHTSEMGINDKELDSLIHYLDIKPEYIYNNNISALSRYITALDAGSKANE